MNKPTSQPPDDAPVASDDALDRTGGEVDARVAAPAATLAEAHDVHRAPGSPALRRVLRTVFWGLWFLFAPFVLACVVVWALSPPSGVSHGGALGVVEEIVRGQPVPVGIALFTLFEMAFWAARQRLPLAAYAQTATRPDVPAGARAAFERARILLDEAHHILERRAREVERDLSASERKQLRDALGGLEEAMDLSPFHEDGFVDAFVKADAEVERRLGRWRKSELREYVESILVAVAVAMALRAFVVEAFKIPSGSMIPTLQVGDHIFVNKFTYGAAIPATTARVLPRMPPDRGDVMVFAFPEHPEQDFIKRVIARPGDKLEAQGGHPIINGWEVPHCYVGIYSYSEGDMLSHEGELYVEFLEDEAYLTLYDRQTFSSSEHQGPYFVKPGEVYVMGDNRNNSHDSRMWWNGQGGGVPFENIKGRALFVWLSISDAGVDWTRLGAPVMGRPRVPKALSHLVPGIDKCLRERPPLSRTSPPPGPGAP